MMMNIQIDATLPMLITEGRPSCFSDGAPQQRSARQAWDVRRGRLDDHISSCTRKLFPSRGLGSIPAATCPSQNTHHPHTLMLSWNLLAKGSPHFIVRRDETENSLWESHQRKIQAFYLPLKYHHHLDEHFQLSTCALFYLITAHF